MFWFSEQFPSSTKKRQEGVLENRADLTDPRRQARLPPAPTRWAAGCAELPGKQPLWKKGAVFWLLGVLNRPPRGEIQLQLMKEAHREGPALLVAPSYQPGCSKPAHVASLGHNLLLEAVLPKMLTKYLKETYKMSICNIQVLLTKKKKRLLY